MVQHRVAGVPSPPDDAAAVEAAACSKDQREERKVMEVQRSTDGPWSHLVVIPEGTTNSSSNSIRKPCKPVVAVARASYSRPLKILLPLFLLLVSLSLLTTTSNVLKYVPLHPTLRYYLTSTTPQQQPLSGLSKYLSLPPTLDHGMTDEELFWRATLSPQIKTYPFNRTSKLALLFLARGHLPLYPLWERFLAGNEGLYSVYVHSSVPGYEAQYPAGSPFHGRQVPSKVAEWGEMSMMDAERRLLANALLDISNERFILLSESCIPLRNFTTVYRYLTASLHSFVSAFDDPGPFGRGRYSPRMAPLVTVDMWRKGSQWFEVDREAAVAIVSDSRYYPLFRDHCRPGCYVDEHYIPTLLTIEMPGKTANRTVTLADWSRGGPHPATFGAGDLQREGFLKRMVDAGVPCQYNGKPEEAVCHLFARKFAPSALQPLLQLAPTVLGF